MKGCKLIESTEKNHPYWTDGEKVYYHVHEIKNADLESFTIYSEDIPWAKDKKTVYCESIPFRRADKETFEALNYSFVKDKLNVWTDNGKIDNADIETFEVCDSGKVYRSDMTLEGRLYKNFRPMGYAKDKNHVYYYNGNDEKAYKPKIIKDAIPATFFSLDDGHFGYDEKSVYFTNKKLKGANPKTWRLFKKGCYYSRDKMIYFENIIMKEADIESFELLADNFYAKDKRNYYNTDTIILKEKLSLYYGLKNITIE